MIENSSPLTKPANRKSGQFAQIGKWLLICRSLSVANELPLVFHDGSRNLDWQS